MRPKDRTVLPEEDVAIVLAEVAGEVVSLEVSIQLVLVGKPPIWTAERALGVPLRPGTAVPA